MESSDSSAQNARAPRHALVKWSAFSLIAGVCALLTFFARQPVPHDAPAPPLRRATHHVPVTPREAVLETGSLSGAVRDPSGKYLSGAMVCASVADLLRARDDAPHCVTTDPLGQFAISRLRPGSYLVTARAEGFAPGSARDGTAVPLRAGVKLEGIDVTLRRGGERITGIVEDATGGPVPGARVSALQQLSTVTLSLDALSDEQGRFSLPAAPGEVALSAVAEGYANADQQAVAPGEVTLVLYPASSVRGTVVASSDNEPVEGVKVYALAAGNAGIPTGPFGLSDEHGDFSIQGLNQGQYVLYGAGGEFAGRSLQPFSVPLGARVEGLVLKVDKGRELRGRVLVAGSDDACPRGYVALGMPDDVEPVRDAAEQAEIAALSPSEIGPMQIANIDADGYVTFPGVPEASYHVTVRCIGHVLSSGPRVLRVAQGDLPEALWTVSEGAALVVHAVDGASKPMPNAVFRLRRSGPEGHGESSRWLPARAETDGTSRLRGLRPGDYELALEGADSEKVVRAQVKANAVTEATLRASDSGSVLVTVQDEQGRAVEDVAIFVLSAAPPAQDAKATPADPRWWRGSSMGNGRFRASPLPSGAYTLRVVGAQDGPHAPNVQAEATLQIADARATELQLRVSRAGRIEGEVRSAAGEPLVNVQVTAAELEEAGEQGVSKVSERAVLSTSRPVLTDTEGHFEIAGLDTRRSYRVRAEQVEGSVVQQGPIHAGQRLALRMLATGSIAGRVVDEQGRPQARYSLRVINSDLQSERTAAIFDASGSFTLDQLPPGKLSLILVEAHPDAAPFEHTLTLQAGQHLRDLTLVLPRKFEAPIARSFP